MRRTRGKCTSTSLTIVTRWIYSSSNSHLHSCGSEQVDLLNFSPPRRSSIPAPTAQAPHSFTSAKKDVAHLIGFVAKRDAAHILSEDLLWESLGSSWIDWRLPKQGPGRSESQRTQADATEGHGLGGKLSVSQLAAGNQADPSNFLDRSKNVASPSPVASTSPCCP